MLPMQYLNSQATKPIHAAFLGADQPLGLFLVLSGTLVALLLLAWRINRSERATGFFARLASLSQLGRLRRYWKRGSATESPPFPESWVEILRRNVRLYGLLTTSEQAKLQELIQRFLAEKQWEGCKGQPINDEVRVTIAGQACLLLLARPEDDFDHVPSILVYPSGFQTEQRALLESKVHTLGQAVYRGPVILAWDEVVEGCRYPADGQNVVVHEFAHQIDFAGDAATTDEAELARRHQRQEVFAAEYERLVEDARHGRETLLDTYGTTSPAEFFAVATECFFGRPVEMREQHPPLYHVLHEFYGQDTAGRIRV